MPMRLEPHAHRHHPHLAPCPLVPPLSPPSSLSPFVVVLLAIIELLVGGGGGCWETSGLCLKKKLVIEKRNENE